RLYSCPAPRRTTLFLLSFPSLRRSPPPSPLFPYTTLFRSVHPGYDDETVAFIGEVLGVSVVRGTVAGIKTVGSVAVATNKGVLIDRKSTRPNSSHDQISYAVFCLKKKKKR